MRYKYCKNIKQCNIGDVLAENIFNNYSVVLAAKDTIINEFIKNKLINMGIENIFIYENSTEGSGKNHIRTYETFNENYAKIIYSMKNIIAAVSRGKKVGAHELADITDYIHSTFNNADTIVRYLIKNSEIDDYLYTHSVNVGFYSMLMAKWLGLTEENVNTAIFAGLLHDIGKIKVPAEILNRRGRLSCNEFEEIKMHTIYGYQIAKEIDGISEHVKNSVLMHHERLDGSGYPWGAVRSDLDTYVRIVSIADVYDAMTTDRIYKKRLSPFEAFQVFLSTGTYAFDINILSKFLPNLAKYYIGSDVELNNGKAGTIVYVPPQNILSPVVSVDSDYIELSRENSIKILSLI